MMKGLQGFVQRRFYLLLMLMIAAGFFLMFVELVLYKHSKGLQIIGTASTVVGAILAFIGVGANGNLRRTLAVVFIILSLVGFLGVVEHNEDRLGGEEDRRPRAAQTTDSQASSESGENEQGENAQGQSGENGESGESGEGSENGEGDEAPPPLAPLGVTGLSAFGAVALLGRRDPE